MTSRCHFYLVTHGWKAKRQYPLRSVFRKQMTLQQRIHTEKKHEAIDDFIKFLTLRLNCGWYTELFIYLFIIIIIIIIIIITIIIAIIKLLATRLANCEKYRNWIKLHFNPFTLKSSQSLKFEKFHLVQGRKKKLSN